MKFSAVLLRDVIILGVYSLVMLKWRWSFWWQNVLQTKKVCCSRRKGEALAETVFFCSMYLVRTASSSGVHAWDTGHHSSSPGPCCNRVCHSSQSCPQDSPGTLLCNTQAGHSRRLTACTHFPPVSTVGWRKKKNGGFAGIRQSVVSVYN